MQTALVIILLLAILGGAVFDLAIMDGYQQATSLCQHGAG